MSLTEKICASLEMHVFCNNFGFGGQTSLTCSLVFLEPSYLKVKCHGDFAIYFRQNGSSI